MAKVEIADYGEDEADRHVLRVETETQPASYSEGNGDEEFDLPLTQVIERLQAALSEIPEEYRDSAMFHVWASGDYAHAYLSVHYDRPESDEDYAARMAKEAAERRTADAARAKAERTLYARLKAKYG